MALRHWFVIGLLLIASFAATAWLLFFDGVDTAVAGFWQAYGWVQANRGVALIIFFLISVVSQMIVMPSGSLMLLFAGFALGGLPAAGVFALAQFLTALPVYLLSQRAIVGIEQGFLKGTATATVERIRAQLGSLKGNDLLATVLLRLTPVIPSAGACLLAAVSGIAIKPFLIATAATCWIRPLFFASSGAALSEVVLRGNATGALQELTIWPLLLVFASALALFLANHVVRKRVN